MKIQELMAIEDFSGFMIKILALTGFNKEQIMILRRTKVCSSKSLSCNCGNLHFLASANFEFIWLPGSFVAKKPYVILPHKLWTEFRQLEFLNDDDFALVDEDCKVKGVDIKDLAEIHGIVTSYSAELQEFDRVLAEFKLENVVNEFQVVVNSYIFAWEIFEQELQNW